MPPHRNDEERPLLSGDSSDDGPQYDSRSESDSTYEIKFTEDDTANPQAWSKRTKLTNVAIIALMALLSPLASTMYAPGIAQIAKDLKTTEQAVIATSSGYLIMLGIGPLILAPCSETFGRRPVYIICFTIFTLLQIPTALSPNVATLIAVRTISGFFGSVGIANGGGTLSDMYQKNKRAGVFGWYLLGPLLGPTIGPLLGGIIVTRLGWRWVYWIMAIIGAANTSIGFFFLRESYAPTILARKKKNALQEQREDERQSADKYYFQGEDRRTFSTKLAASMKRPVVIFIQPVILIMAIYQAIIFGTTFSIYTNLQKVFQHMPYEFASEQIGLLYLGPGLGFLTCVLFLVPKIDVIYDKLTAKNNGKELPEFRLPLANIGSVLIPLSLFWFAWTVESRQHWFVIISSTFFYGIGQVIVFNCVQNYYIDSFEKYAASALAGGAVFRSLVGGLIPLMAPALFERLGYGWGISLFALFTVMIAPSPILLYFYGGRLRERFPLSL